MNLQPRAQIYAHTKIAATSFNTCYVPFNEEANSGLQVAICVYLPLRGKYVIVYIYIVYLL